MKTPECKTWPCNCHNGTQLPTELTGTALSICDLLRKHGASFATRKDWFEFVAEVKELLGKK